MPHALARALAALVIAVPLAASAAAPKAAFVEEVIPSKPFNTMLDLRASRPSDLKGPGTGVLGITSVTVVNYESGTQWVWLAPAGVDPASGKCQGATLGLPSSILEFLVPARSTLHFAYPTPVAVSPASNNTTCIMAGANGVANGIQVYVNGIVN